MSAIIATVKIMIIPPSISATPRCICKKMTDTKVAPSGSNASNKVAAVGEINCKLAK